MHGLVSDHIIKINEAASDQSGGVKTIELSDAERECGRENFDFYCFLIWPFIEASWLGAVSLTMLTPPLGHTGPFRVDAKKAQHYAQLVSV